MPQSAPGTVNDELNKGINESTCKKNWEPWADTCETNGTDRSGQKMTAFRGPASWAAYGRNPAHLDEHDPVWVANVEHFCCHKMTKASIAPKKCAGQPDSSMCIDNQTYDYLRKAYLQQVFETKQLATANHDVHTNKQDGYCDVCSAPETPNPPILMTWQCIDHYSQTIRVHIENAHLTESKDTFSKADPYTVMFLEGPGGKNELPPYDQVVRTHVVQNAGMDPAWNFEQNFQFWKLQENATFKVYDMDGSDETADLFGQVNVEVGFMLSEATKTHGKMYCGDDSDEEFPFDCLHPYNLTRPNYECVRGEKRLSPARGAYQVNQFGTDEDDCSVQQPVINMAFKYSWRFTDVPADNQAYKRFGNLLLEDDVEDVQDEASSSYLWAAPVALLGGAVAAVKYFKSGKKSDVKTGLI